MLNLEIDGKPVQVKNGATVMDAANQLGVYIPYFCYHKKLSIAANCRMCLVHVEKAPKAVPACATPATEGMKVWTHSDQAIAAQKSVMEFLLINHPLDCPICDQGGECQLQDLAVGYGGSSSRYHEAKRVVFRKHLGPLVAAEEMTRCIQCTRCARCRSRTRRSTNAGSPTRIASRMRRSIRKSVSRRRCSSVAANGSPSTGRPRSSTSRTVCRRWWRSMAPARWVPWCHRIRRS